MPGSFKNFCLMELVSKYFKGFGRGRGRGVRPSGIDEEAIKEELGKEKIVILESFSYI
jgi:hypothetical protein